MTYLDVMSPVLLGGAQKMHRIFSYKIRSPHRISPGGRQPAQRVPSCVNTGAISFIRSPRDINDDFLSYQKIINLHV
jgi:hypothetical protein